MNILIVNQPLNNRGDESAHRALVRSIIKYIPNVNVRVLFMGANAECNIIILNISIGLRQGPS